MDYINSWPDFWKLNISSSCLSSIQWEAEEAGKTNLTCRPSGLTTRSANILMMNKNKLTNNSTSRCMVISALSALTKSEVESERQIYTFHMLQPYWAVTRYLNTLNLVFLFTVQVNIVNSVPLWAMTLHMVVVAVLVMVIQTIFMGFHCNCEPCVQCARYMSI